MTNTNATLVTMIMLQSQCGSESMVEDRNTILSISAHFENVYSSFIQTEDVLKRVYNSLL